MNIHVQEEMSNLNKIRSRTGSVFSICCLLIAVRDEHEYIAVSILYQVRSKSHMLVLSARFWRKVADWSIYDTFMLTPDLDTIT
jgi:hypothetical protein